MELPDVEEIVLQKIPLVEPPGDTINIQVQDPPSQGRWKKKVKTLSRSGWCARLTFSAKLSPVSGAEE